MRTPAKVIAAVGAGLTIVLVALYAALPLLVARFGADYLEQQGFDKAEVEIGYPGWRELTVGRVVLVSSALDLHASNARIEYRWPELFSGKLKSLHAELVALTIKPRDEPSAEPTDLSLGPLFAAVPFEAVTVDQLHVRVPELEFRALGSASLLEGVLDFDLKGLEPAIASQFKVDGELSQDGRLAFRFVDQAAEGSDYLNLSGQVGKHTLDIAGDVGMSGYAFDLASAAAGLPVGSGNVHGTFQLKIPWPIPPDVSLQDITAEATQTHAAWQSADEVTEFDVRLTSAKFQQGRATATLAGSLITRIDKYGVTAQIPADTTLQFQAGQITGSPGLQISVTDPEINLLATINSFALRNDTAPHLEFDARINTQSAGGDLAGDLVADLTLKDRTAPMDDVHGQVTFTGAGGFDGARHTTNIKAAYQFSAPTLTATGQATISVLDNVHVALMYDTQSGAGILDLNDSLELREPLLAALLPDYTEVYDVDSGLIETTVKLNWQSPDKIAAETTLSLQDVAAHYEDYIIGGISGRAVLHTPDVANLDTWRLAPTTLQADPIDVGFPLNDAVLAMSFADGQLNISQARASLLGGQANAAPFKYDPVPGNADFTLTLTDLDLAEVLALEGDDVSGTGRLSGTLPVSIVGNDPTVQNGLVQAHPPGGVIQLSPTLAVPTGQPGLDFALSALQDFRYTSLDAKVDYAANGDLKLGVSLLGNNPAVEKGRAIEYNVNISENLPVLLESLRLQDKITERIEQRVKNQ